MGSESDHIPWEETWQRMDVSVQGKDVFGLPGLMDSHIHLSWMGALSRQLDLRDTHSISSLLSKVEAYAKKCPPGTWIIGRGWSQSTLGAWPTKQDLAHFTAPVLLERVCGHVGIVNQVALDLLGILPDTPSPPNGTFDHEKGLLAEWGLDVARRFIRDKVSLDIRIEEIQWAMRRCSEMGLVAVGSNDAQCVEVYDLLAKDGLPLRVYQALFYSVLDEEHPPPERNSDIHAWTQVHRIKLLTDGALGPKTAALSRPYVGSEDCGALLYTQEAFTACVQRAHAQGYQLEVHAIGDAAAEMVLTGFHAVGLGPFDRPLLTHAQLLNESMVQRMHETGVIANVQPSFVTTDAEWISDTVPASILQEHPYAWKTLLDRGVHVAGGSDAPVELSSPLLGMHAAMFRRDLQGVPYRPSERLCFSEALALYTTGAAYAFGKESGMGRIAKGFAADFTFCSDCVWENPEALCTTVVERTVILGKTTFVRKDTE